MLKTQNIQYVECGQYTEEEEEEVQTNISLTAKPQELIQNKRTCIIQVH
jgi:hypothetical protein